MCNAITSKELDILRESAVSGTSHKVGFDNPLSLDHFRQVITDISAQQTSKAARRNLLGLMKHFRKSSGKAKKLGNFFATVLYVKNLFLRQISRSMKRKSVLDSLNFTKCQ